MSDPFKTICSALLDDINILEEKLEISIEREAKFPLDLEPIDPEKKLLRERVNTLEAQLQLMTERYKSLHSNITKIRTETYKLRQKMKYKVTLDQSHKRTISQPFSVEDIKAPQVDNLEEEELEEDIDLPDNLSPASTIEYLKQQLIQSRNEKKLLSARLDNMETKLAGFERFRKLSSSAPFSQRNRKVTVATSDIISDIPAIEKKGPLLKRGGTNYNKWQKRYFILSFSPERNIFILTYKGMRGQVKGQLALAWCTVQQVTDPKLKNEHCFMLSPRIIDKKKKNYYLSASSKSEMLEWIKVIETAAAYIPTVEEILCGKPVTETKAEDKRTRAETTTP